MNHLADCEWMRWERKKFHLWIHWMGNEIAMRMDEEHFWCIDCEVCEVNNRWFFLSPSINIQSPLSNFFPQVMVMRKLQCCFCWSKFHYLHAKLQQFNEKIIFQFTFVVFCLLEFNFTSSNIIMYPLNSN